jgi:hypothetical protein
MQIGFGTGLGATLINMLADNVMIQWIQQGGNTMAAIVGLSILPAIFIYLGRQFWWAKDETIGRIKEGALSVISIFGLAGIIGIIGLIKYFIGNNGGSKKKD